MIKEYGAAGSLLQIVSNTKSESLRTTVLDMLFKVIISNKCFLSNDTRNSFLKQTTRTVQRYEDIGALPF